jgi:hypothetical protein
MRWRWFYFLLVPFTLPNIIASLLLALPYGVERWRFHSGCLELIAKRNKHGLTRIWGRPHGQSLGCPVVWYASAVHWDSASLRVHERCHAVQGMLGLGLLFGLAYGLSFLFAWARQGFGPWHAAYMANPFERQAYARQARFESGQVPDAWGA